MLQIIFFYQQLQIFECKLRYISNATTCSQLNRMLSVRSDSTEKKNADTMRCHIIYGNGIKVPVFMNDSFINMRESPWPTNTQTRTHTCTHTQREQTDRNGYDYMAISWRRTTIFEIYDDGNSDDSKWWWWSWCWRWRTQMIVT